MRGLYSLSLLCRTAVPHVRRLAILCGGLEVKDSCLPWRENVLALRFLVQNSAIQRTIRQLSRGSQDSIFDHKRRIPGPDGHKPIWISCRIVDEAKTSSWKPESESIYKVLHGVEPSPELPSDSDDDESDYD